MKGVLLELCVLVVYSLIVIYSDEFQLRLDLSTDSANVGETLKAVCHVTKIPATPFTKSHYQIIWFKILPESRVEEVEIATNTFLNDDFNITGRFKAFLQHHSPANNNEVDFFLHIFNVQVEDSGYLGCKVGVPGITAESFKQFVVNVPVLNVWWSSPSSNPYIVPTEYKQNENLSFYEGESCHFVCNVNGSYPRPQIKIFIGSEDLTRFFTTSADLIRGSGQRGLQPIYYLLQITNKSFIIDYRFNEKELRCVAAMDLMKFNDVKSTSIVIQVTEYRPKFFCSKRMLVELDQLNFTFSCIVRARPEIAQLNVSKLQGRTNTSSWNNAKFNLPFVSNTSTDLGLVRDVTFPDIIIQDTNPTEKLVTVFVGKVASDQLGIYIFEAINDVGNSYYEVELHQIGHFHRYTSYYVSTNVQTQINMFAQFIILSITFNFI